MSPTKTPSTQREKRRAKRIEEMLDAGITTVGEFHYIHHAADQGDAITQLRLGEASEAGNGVEANLEQAVAWYRQSAERGNADARAALERLGG